MPVEVDLTHEEYVCLRASDTLAFDDLLDALRSMSSNPRIPAGGRHLLDLREMKSLPLDSSHFRKILAEKENIKTLLKGGRIAIVTPSDPSLAVPSAYKQLVARLPFDYKFFRDFDEAHEWLAGEES